jgi:nucleotide-binding universal stress UspA family protein
MKVKPSPKRGRVVVEVDRKDEQLLSGTVAGAVPTSSFELKKVLVPVDFSPCSRKALRYALAFARQFQARLTLLHVLPANYFIGSEFGPIDFPLPETELRQGAERELAAVAAREVGAATPVETVVRQGQPVQEIVRFAGEAEIDLVILSTHGRTGLKHVLMGSVAENVVRYAPCPVLVVREFEHEFLGAAR